MTTYPSGIAFPFRFRSAGGVSKADGGTKVWSNLQALVKSSLKERLVRKDVGSVGYQHVLRSSVTSKSGIIESLLREAVTRFEPRAVGLDIRVYSEDLPNGNHVYADISFIFKFTGDPVSETLQLD